MAGAPADGRSTGHADTPLPRPMPSPWCLLRPDRIHRSNACSAAARAHTCRYAQRKPSTCCLFVAANINARWWWKCPYDSSAPISRRRWAESQARVVGIHPAFRTSPSKAIVRSSSVVWWATTMLRVRRSTWMIPTRLLHPPTPAEWRPPIVRAPD